MRGRPFDPLCSASSNNLSRMRPSPSESRGTPGRSACLMTLVFVMAKPSNFVFASRQSSACLPVAFQQSYTISCTLNYTSSIRNFNLSYAPHLLLCCKNSSTGRLEQRKRGGRGERLCIRPALYTLFLQVAWVIEQAVAQDKRKNNSPAQIVLSSGKQEEHKKKPKPPKNKEKILMRQTS